MLGWHIDSVVKCGLAGTILFTWTDEWFTGGQEITDWAFGTRHARAQAEEGVLTPFRQSLGETIRFCLTFRCRGMPFVSVIVCSYNGGRLLLPASIR